MRRRGVAAAWAAGGLLLAACPAPQSTGGGLIDLPDAGQPGVGSRPAGARARTVVVGGGCPSPKASGSPKPKASGSPGTGPSPKPTGSPSPKPTGSPSPRPGVSPSPSPRPSASPAAGATPWPSPTPTAGTPIIGGPPGTTWERAAIGRIYLGSEPRAGVALEVLAEASVNLCCYPGNLLRFQPAGEYRVAIEMGGWVPHGRVCSACILPGVLTGAGRFTPDRPGKWTLFDRYTGVSFQVRVP